MPEFKPEDSYGSCVVLVPDTGELFEAFAAGMRAAHGKLLVSQAGVVALADDERVALADTLTSLDDLAGTLPSTGS